MMIAGPLLAMRDRAWDGIEVTGRYQVNIGGQKWEVVRSGDWISMMKWFKVTCAEREHTMEGDNARLVGPSSFRHIEGRGQQL